MVYRIKNWKKFQHFKDRKPAWIKLYRELLDDKEWHELPAESAKILVMLWLIASENDGVLPNSSTLAFRLRIRETSISAAVKALDHWLEHDDITVISNGYQADSLEKEREGEKETETDNGVVSPPAAPVGPTPEDLFKLWNKEAHPNLPRVQLLTEPRKRQCKSRLLEYPNQDFWEDVMSRVNRSPLLRGDKGSWKATFDWVLQPSNLAKILEGNYDPDSRR